MSCRCSHCSVTVATQTTHLCSRKRRKRRRRKTWKRESEKERDKKRSQQRQDERDRSGGRQGREGGAKRRETVGGRAGKDGRTGGDVRTNEGEEKVKKKKKMDKLVLSQFSQLRKRTVLGCFLFCPGSDTGFFSSCQHFYHFWSRDVTSHTSFHWPMGTGFYSCGPLPVHFQCFLPILVIRDDWKGTHSGDTPPTLGTTAVIEMLWKV